MIGYSSWDNLANYVYRVIELEPDMLIIYAGFNDARPRSADPECYRGLNPRRGLDPMRGPYSAVNLGPGSVSALYRLLAIRLGWMTDPSVLTTNFRDMPDYCLPARFDDRNIADNPPVYFERNLRSIITLAHGLNTEVMLSTWTHRPDPRDSFPALWLPAIDEHNDITRALAAEYDLPFYDLAATDFGSTLVHWAGDDPVHMSAVGTHEQARLYAAYLHEQEIIPRSGTTQ
jgi:lysophospholipase L1-like esterase